MNVAQHTTNEAVIEVIATIYEIDPNTHKRREWKRHFRIPTSEDEETYITSHLEFYNNQKSDKAPKQYLADWKITEESLEISEMLLRGDITKNLSKVSRIDLLRKIAHIKRSHTKEVEPMRDTLTEMMHKNNFLQSVVSRQSRKIRFMNDKIKEFRKACADDSLIAQVFDELLFQIMSYEDEDKISQGRGSTR